MLIVEALLLTLASPGFSQVGGVKTSCLENLRGKTGRARIEIVVGSGALNETPKERGAAHLLEHLLLRPLGFDHSNGATSWDYTSYYQDVRAGELQKAAIELLSALRSPRFDEQAFLLEQKIVLRELSDRGLETEVRTDPLFGDTLLSRAPGASAQSVRELSRDLVLRFHQQHYRKGNIAVMIRGAASCLDIQEALKETLQAFPDGPAVTRPEINAPEPGRRTLPSGPDRFIRGYYWYDASPQEEVILRALAKHLEQRALEELRKAQGLTYSPSSSFLRRGSGGSLELTVTTDGQSSAVEAWFVKTRDALLGASDPRRRMEPAIKEVADLLESDAVRSALAEIREEPQPEVIAQKLDAETLRKALPKLMDERRSFGSTVPQSNVVSIIILVGFGVLVLGVLLYTGRQFF